MYTEIFLPSTKFKTWDPICIHQTFKAFVGIVHVMQHIFRIYFSVKGTWSNLTKCSIPDHNVTLISNTFFLVLRQKIDKSHENVNN